MVISVYTSIPVNKTLFFTIILDKFEDEVRKCYTKAETG